MSYSGRKYRSNMKDNLSYLLHRCTKCRKLVLDHLFDCSCDYLPQVCKKELMNLVKSFWCELGGRSCELSAVLDDGQLRKEFVRLISIASKWGLNNPLIIPTTIKWEATNQCNLRCQHCIASSGSKKKNELSTTEVKELIDQAVCLGIKNLGVLGGEPLLREDIFYLIRYAHEKKLNITLSTNGTLIDGAIEADLAISPIKNVAISLDGLEDYHDEIRGRAGSFQKTICGIEKLVKMGKRVAVNMVVTKKNIGSVEELLKLVASLGVKSFAPSDLIPAGRAAEIHTLCISDKQYRALSLKMDELRNKYKYLIKLKWYGAGKLAGYYTTTSNSYVFSRCGAGLSELTIGSDGVIRCCPFLEETNLNIRDQTLETIWFASKEVARYQNRNTLEGECGKCVFSMSCSGCRARAKAYTNNAFASDPRCLLRTKV